MLYICTGDIHCGDGGPQDDFVQHPERLDKFEEQLVSIKREKSRSPRNVRVIVTADTFNGEYGILKCLNSLTGYRIMLAMRNVVDVYCVGNHDSELWKYRSHPLLAGLNLADRAFFGKNRDIMFMHGHQVDIFNGTLGFIGKAVSGMAAIVGKVSPTLEDKLRTTRVKGSGGRNADADSFKQMAVADMKKHNCRVVVCGHTHEAPKDGPVYFNTGLWSRDGWQRFEIE